MVRYRIVPDSTYHVYWVERQKYLFWERVVIVSSVKQGEELIYHLKQKPRYY